MSNLIQSVYYLDLSLTDKKWLRSIYYIAIEIPCLISHLMAIVMLLLSVTISQIFIVKNVHDHDIDLWTVSRSNAITLIKPIHDSKFDGNYNVCHMGYHIHIQAICCQNVHDLDYDLHKGPRSNVRMSFKSPYITSHTMVVPYLLSFER